MTSSGLLHSLEKQAGLTHVRDANMDIQLVVGTRLFFLQDEKDDWRVIQAGSTGRITEVTDQDFKMMVELPSSRWSDRFEEKEITVALPLESADRFLFLQDQVIDGLHFSAKVPTETGQYWFFGKSRAGTKEVRLGHGKVVKNPQNTSYWFFRDATFAGKSFEMDGLWAKAFVPKMPGYSKPTCD